MRDLPKAESDLYLDGEAAVDFVINNKRTSPDRIVLYGQSLGTAIVTEVAARRVDVHAEGFRKKCGAGRNE